MSKNSNCVLCKKITAKLVSKYLTNIWKENDIFINIKIETCTNCGIGIALPAPSQSKLVEFYANDYRRKGSPFYFDFNRRLKPFSRNSRSIAQLLLGLNFVELLKDDIFVDIGPGQGTSFRELQGIVRENQILCYAIELSKNADDYYKRLYGVRTYSDFKIFLKEVKRKPKLILSSHSLEHFNFEDAIELLNYLSSSISHDSYCVFEVPHVDLRVHENLRGSDDPHLLFFSKQSLKKMFQSCNFDVLFIETCGELYEKKHQSLNNLNKLKFLDIAIKNIFKTLLNLSPKFSNFFLDKFSKVKINDENFRYGGNRKCIRIVARPCR
jgi:hypothetical protein